jgi:hypothetical protein
MRAEHGEFTLVGLLVAMSLFLGVIAASLSLFSTSEVDNRQIQSRNDAMDRARAGVDLMSRQLRNMASPTPEQPQAIARAGATDAIFQTVDKGPTVNNARNIMRVRYCLDASGSMWRQNQTWTSATPPAAPTDTACPSLSSEWATRKVIVDNVTNLANGHNRPLFTYQPNATDPTAIRGVHVDLFADLDAARKPLETLLSSGVYLRNQNQKPVADFTATSSSQGIVLNASASTDAEGEPLVYCWYETLQPNLAAGSPNLPSPCDPGTLLGTGPTITDQVARGQTRTITLIVKDPALLASDPLTKSPTN